jgi:hypothetical protein
MHFNRIIDVQKPPRVDDGSQITPDFPPSDSKAPKNSPIVERYNSER